MAQSIVFIDVETTGVNPNKDKIIQLSAIRFSGHKETARFNTYVNPGRAIPPDVTNTNGITDEMVVDAPTIHDIRDQFLNFIQDAFVVGYNVSFDLNFINLAFEGALASIEYLDMRYLAQMCLDLPNYQLSTVAQHLDIHPSERFHNSLSDCEVTADIFWTFGVQLLLSESHTYSPRKSRRTKKFESFSPKDITPSVEPSDSGHPLYGKNIVFTGELSISRNSAAQMAVDAGAIIKTSVSRKTNYLVVGTQDPAIVGSDGISGKEEKAHELNSSGKASIAIISEREFMSLFEKEHSA